MYIGLYKTPNKALSCLVLSITSRPPSPFETRRELEPKCVAQSFLGSQLVTCQSAISQFFPFSRKSFGPISSLLKRPMTGQVCNFVSSFILILWDRFFPVRSWRQRAWKGTDFKLTASFIEFQLYSMQYLVVYNPWSPTRVYHLIFRENFHT